MNKATTINLSGQVFTTDDDAFDLLRAYLDRLRTQLKAEDDRDEIMQDFEQAVAEHLLEVLKSKDDVVTAGMVKKVTKAIGEYEPSEETEVPPKPSAGSFLKHPLYLDKKNAMIGGVAAGIARAIEIDSFWIRAAFVVLAFATQGLAVLAYIVLMLIMKEPQNLSQQLEAEGTKTTAAALVAHSKKRFQDAQASLSHADVPGQLKPVGRAIKSIVRTLLVIVSSLIIALETVVFAVLVAQLLMHHDTALLSQYVSRPLAYVVLMSAYFVLVLPVLMLLLVAASKRIGRKALTTKTTLIFFVPWLVALSVFIAGSVQAVPRVVDWSRANPHNPYFQLQVKNGQFSKVCINPGGHCNDHPHDIKIIPDGNGYFVRPDIHDMPAPPPQPSSY